MHVASLHIHPLKSGAIVDRTEAEVTMLGLVGDRHLMVVDRDGRFITQRGHPRLALVRCAIDATDATFVVPGREPITVSLAGGESMRVEVWGDWLDATVLDARLDAWISDYLDIDARVVRFAADAVRIADQTWAGPEDRVAFADGFAVLVTTTGSLRDLNTRLESPVPMSRFRPNLVIACDEPWAEDSWQRIRVGEVELAVIKPCGRCVIVNVDQATGRSGREPLRTLTSFRQHGKRVVFGQNAVPRRVGVVRLGDPVEVLERS